MFLLLFEKNNKKEATINSITTNMTSTLEFVINISIIDLTFICSKLSKSLLNIKCILTVKYAITHTLNIKATINNIFLLIFPLSYFYFSLKVYTIYLKKSPSI